MAKPSLESCRVDPGDGFQYLSSYQNVSRWKNRNWWKKNFKIFFLTNFLKGYFKAFPEKPFFSKNHFFVFCRKFGFDLEKLSNHYSQLKKQVKVDPETRSYDFLTKTREKNPMSGNIRILGMTLGFHLNPLFVQFFCVPTHLTAESNIMKFPDPDTKRDFMFFYSIHISTLRFDTSCKSLVINLCVTKQFDEVRWSLNHSLCAFLLLRLGLLLFVFPW